jgi:hypothetical protein
MSKHRRDCVALCIDAGLNVLGVDDRGRHLTILCTEGRVVMPYTPGDWRWRRNARAQARRMARGL